jgi:hypothetical protein
MTKVQIRYRLVRPLESPALASLASLHTKYGILKTRVADAGDLLTVEFDATRLRAADVTAALSGVGIAVLPE